MGRRFGMEVMGGGRCYVVWEEPARGQKGEKKRDVSDGEKGMPAPCN